MTVIHSLIEPIPQADPYEVDEKSEDATLAEVVPSPTGPYSIESTSGTIVQVESSDGTIAIETYAPKCPGKRPCIIFSHGWEENSSRYRPLVKELASHGYVVLCIDHPSSSKPFPLTPETAEEVIGERTRIQAKNIESVVDRVRKGEFADLRISDKIVLAGHSMGGAASVLVSRQVPHIAGCINLDGKLHGNDQTRTAGLSMPLLLISADHLKDAASDPDPQGLQQWIKDAYEPQVRDWQALVASNPLNKFEKIPGIGHMDFCGLPTSLREPVDPRSLEGPMKAHVETSKAILQFMGSLNDP